MDANEMRTLEEKTRKIVETLSALESELSSQRRANEDLAAERERLTEFSSSLMEAAVGLRDVTELLKRSTFSKELDAIDEGLKSLKMAGERIDARLDALASLDDGLGKRVSALESLKDEIESIIDAKLAEGIASLESVGAALDSKMDMLSDIDRRANERMGTLEHLKDEILGSLDAKLAEMENVIGRIDRNTQKGIGKERG